MTIAILKKEPGQAIPRPFNRACGVAEMEELLEDWTSAFNLTCPLQASNLDTDEPVLVVAAVEFYAFTE